jgi:hypothetical protein
MTSVAGDFYDLIVAADTQAGLLIADVSGYGVPAARIASMVKLAAGSERGNARDPAGWLTGMNAALLILGVRLDSISGRLRDSAPAIRRCCYSGGGVFLK